MMRKLVSAEAWAWCCCREFVIAANRPLPRSLPIETGGREDRRCAVVVAQLRVIALADGGLQDAVRGLKSDTEYLTA